MQAAPLSRRQRREVTSDYEDRWNGIDYEDEDDWEFGSRMNPAGSRIEALTKELSLQWQQTRSYWSDAKSQEFEQKYLQELFSSVDRTMVVIEQLDKLLSKIRRDCE